MKQLAPVEGLLLWKSLWIGLHQVQSLETVPRGALIQPGKVAVSGFSSPVSAETVRRYSYSNQPFSLKSQGSDLLLRMG